MLRHLACPGVAGTVTVRGVSHRGAAMAAVDLDEPAVAQDVAAAARGDRPSDRRRRASALAEREQGDVGAHPPADRRHERVVRVQHGPAVRSRRAGDGRLDLRELGQGVDPL